MTHRTLEQLARDVVAVWVDKGCTSTDLGRPIAALAARLDHLDRVADELDEVASRPHDPEQLLRFVDRADATHRAALRRQVDRLVSRRELLHLDELAARAARARQAAAQYDEGRVHGEGGGA